MSQPTLDTECKTLLSCLGAQRNHILGILADLDDEDLRRPVLPSGGPAWDQYSISPWISSGSGSAALSPGEQPVIDELAEAPEDAWHVGSDVPAEAVFGLYRQEIELANAIITATPLDARERDAARWSFLRRWARPGQSPTGRQS